MLVGFGEVDAEPDFEPDGEGLGDFVGFFDGSGPHTTVGEGR